MAGETSRRGMGRGLSASSPWRRGGCRQGDDREVYQRFLLVSGTHLHETEMSAQMMYHGFIIAGASES